VAEEFRPTEPTDRAASRVGEAPPAQGDDPPARGGPIADDPPGEILAVAETLAEPGRPRARDWRMLAGKGLHLAVALFLFVLAIELMKSGAKAIGPTITGSFPFDNGISTLGFGWLGAYFVLSGSPVAAVALSLFDGGVTTTLQTFTMLSGSRLGASFIVLLVGFVYAVRDRSRDRGEPIGMGILALSLTAIVYLPGMMIGYGLLKSGSLEVVTWHASDDVLGLIDYVWGPIKGTIVSQGAGDFGLVPPTFHALLLPIGLGVILLSFKLLDRVLPEIDGERAHDTKGHWLTRPWPMFFLGCLAATVTLSVSVALTALVPLASKGLIRRREAIPYIMGANITTLADTLVAAMVLGNAVAVQIVLAEAIGVTIVTLAYLAFFYRPIVRTVIALDDWVVGSNRRLSLFVVTLFVLPVIFLMSGLFIGPITQ
jgi:Na+/phosphate symporter